jgi:hypothetical protein
MSRNHTYTGARTAALGGVVAALGAMLLAGCGGGSDKPSAVATPTSQPATTAERKPPKIDTTREVLFLKRITATPDPIVDEVRVHADGVAAYRTIYGGHSSSRYDSAEKLSKRQWTHLQDLMHRAKLRGADHVGAGATPGGFYYILRVRGKAVATASGHVAPGVRPLIDELTRIADVLIPQARP